MSTLTDQKSVAAFTTAGTVTLGVPGAIRDDTDTAASFTASGSGYATAGDVYDYAGAQAFSWAFWIKLRVALGSATLDRILTKDGSDGGGRQGYLIYFGGSGTVAAARYVNGSGVFVNSVSAVNDTGWRFVTLTYDGTNLRLYIDSVLESTSTSQTAGLVGNTADLLLSAYNAFGGYSDIVLDELATWSRALTQGEITTLWNEGRPLLARRAPIYLRSASAGMLPRLRVGV